MKKRRLLLTCALLAVLAAAVFSAYKQNTFIKGYVRLFDKRLDALAAEAPETLPDGESIRYGLWKMKYMAEQNMLVFSFGGSGRYGTHRGFYYSPNDLPLDCRGGDAKFLRDGAGWIWLEENGDSRQYTEKIRDRWYWYEAYP